jgi:enamine deaminase RidA (YjgF/YER057c/UK114 family)
MLRQDLYFYGSIPRELSSCLQLNELNMSKRENFPSGAPWEKIIGYSRAVRCGNLIEISGTISIDESGNSTGVGDPYAQTVEIINIASRVLEKAGSRLEDVVRTRIYVTDISRWEEIGKAHGAFFGEVMPATSMVEVSALIRPESMVEIEFTAYAGSVSTAGEQASGEG